VHDGGRCRDIAVRVEVLPVEGIAGAVGELLEEGALRPAIPLTEGVDLVDLAEVISQPVEELVPCQAPEEVFLTEPTEDLGRWQRVVRQGKERELCGRPGSGNPGPLPAPVAGAVEGEVPQRGSIRYRIAA
jgi:hypothetical protein